MTTGQEGIRIYTDESVDIAVAEGLKRRGVHAWSAREAGNLGLTDKEQLEYAVRERAVIFTHDDDFLSMVAKSDQEHYGVIYVHQQKLSAGECIRRLKTLAETRSVVNMKDRIEFL
ncbi:DUF5615 family PIN-like protein [Candidatus Bipolaricaulota bacterium]|nr:DUF5615 family PIN-like protein [Candidatus Bipolaricaulota bacterium]